MMTKGFISDTWASTLPPTIDHVFGREVCVRSKLSAMRLPACMAVILLTLHAAGQSAPPPAEPQVNPDLTVTFRYTAPSAAQVALSLEGSAKPVPMQKNGAGVWTVTTGALKPELYAYHFEVDGRRQLDPLSTLTKSSYTAIENAVLIPGPDGPMPWETTAVPHGIVHRHTYTSNVVLGLDANQSEFFVYTPPGYDPRAKTIYPVLYLLHGWSDRADGWISVGHANDILDNLIAQGKARPMIVVMTLGYGDMSFVRSTGVVWNRSESVDRNTSLYSKALLTEVIPQVERLYRVSAKREDRAIAGLSMGGLESLSVGLTHTDQFAWIGGFSAAVQHFDPAIYKGLDPKKAKLKLLYLDCGTEDSLIEPVRHLSAELKTEGFDIKSTETVGFAHNWLVWRPDLIAFASTIFQPK
jgi:enterochelin esterase family protein